jgi:hypothetical protein
MDAADLELFRRSLSHALSEQEGSALDEALDELGWSDALELEPDTAVTVLFELQGLTNSNSSALEQVLRSAGGIAREAGTRLLLPRVGEGSAPGRLAGGRCSVSGLLRGGVAAGDRAVVVAQVAEGRHQVVLVPIAELELRVIDGMDPALELVELCGEVSADVDAEASVDWEAMVARGSLAIGQELVGSSRAMLELARSHALERVQFGVPISSFQAVRHRLAEVLIAIESSQAMLVAAWEDGSLLTASMAKAYAGRSARSAAAHCQQVLAGMGFTAEHQFHHHFRRVLVLEQLFGSSVGLTRKLGEQLLAERGAPALFPL